MNLKLLTAAAVLTTAIAAPAFAQDPVARAPSVRHQQEVTRVYHHRDSGFWPGELAAGIVGGAIGTAEAVVTAPFRYDDAYAYNDPYYRYYSRDFVCQPGMTFRGEDGRVHICQ
jgi:hypothetical protein